MIKSVRLVSALFAVFLIAACSKPVDKYIASAKSHQAKGQDREAAIELKNALAAEPDSAEANFLLGRLLLKVGNPLDAQHALRNALKFGRAPEEVLPLLGEALLEMEKFGDALDALKVGAELDRGTMARLAVLRGRAYLGQGALLDARTQFQLAKADLAREATLGFVRLALAANDRKEATALIDELLAGDPNQADAWTIRGDMLRADGRTEEALKAFRKASEVAPDHVVALLGEAVVLLTTGNVEGAKKLVSRADRIAPLKPMLEFVQALLAYHEKRLEDARAALQRLLDVVPTYAPGLMLAGALNYSTEQFELAQNAYTAFLTHDPGNLYARRMLGATLLAKGQPKLAAQTLDPVVGSSSDPALLATAGRAHLTMGRVNRATELMRRAVALAPANPDLRTSLGLTYLFANSRAQAIAEFESAISLGPDNARPDHALTMVLLGDKQFEKAERVAAGAESRLKGRPEGLMLRGAVQLARKNDAAAKPFFERALKLSPTFLPAAEALADIEARESKPDALRRRVEAVLDRDPKNVGALLILARLDMQEGRGDKAVAAVRQVLTQHPRSLQALLILAQTQLGAGKVQDAIISARRASEEHPWDTRAIDLLADAQLAANDNEAALGTLNSLAGMRPGDIDVQVRIAALQASMGDPRSAVSRLQAVLRQDKRNVRAQSMLAEIYMGMKRVDDALVIARDIQKQHPKAAQGYRLEGEILLATRGSANQAVKSFEQAARIEQSGPILVGLHKARTTASGQPAPTRALHDWLRQNPSDFEVQRYLADFYNSSGQYKEAIAEYSALTARTTADFGIHNNFAWALLQVGDHAKAQHFAELAVKARPHDPLIMDTLGNVMLARGRASEAVQILLQASAKAPDNPEIRYHLAEALVAVGDVGRARKELQALLSAQRPFARAEEARGLLRKLGS